MLYEVKLRVTDQPWLGEQRTRERVRRFRRDKKNRIAINKTEWQWAFASAAKALRFDIDVATIRTETGFEAPSLNLYTRKYHFKGKPHEEMFESISEGTVLTIPILVMESREDDKEGQQQRPPSHEELQDILKFVGRFIGLSPWGTRWGYGTFEIEEMIQV